MMKKFIGLMALLALVCFAGRAMASDGDEFTTNSWQINSSGTLLPLTASAENIGSTSYPVSTIYANDLVLVGSGGQYRTVGLPLMGFIVSDAAVTVLGTTAGLLPYIAMGNTAPHVVYSDGVTSPIMVTFRVPDDYYSSGSFRVMADTSYYNAVTQVKVDFKTMINATLEDWDASATDQTPVALSAFTALHSTASATTTTTPCVVTLSVATDFSSLAAGDYVTLHLWRDNTTGDATGALEIYAVNFVYKSNR